MEKYTLKIILTRWVGIGLIVSWMSLLLQTADWNQIESVGVHL